jgi:hypothetical protein
MYAFGKSNLNKKENFIENIFNTGFFISHEDYLKFEKKNKNEITEFFKNIQDSTFMENPTESKEHLIDKDKSKVFVVQEYQNYWQPGKKTKPFHKISICKNPKNIINKFSNRKQTGSK